MSIPDISLCHVRVGIMNFGIILLLLFFVTPPIAMALLLRTVNSVSGYDMRSFLTVIMLNNDNHSAHQQTGQGTLTTHMDT